MCRVFSFLFRWDHSPECLARRVPQCRSSTRCSDCVAGCNVSLLALEIPGEEPRLPRHLLASASIAENLHNGCDRRDTQQVGHEHKYALFNDLIEQTMHDHKSG